MVAWKKVRSVVFPTPHILNTLDGEQGRAHPPDGPSSENFALKLSENPHERANLRAIRRLMAT